MKRVTFYFKHPGGVLPITAECASSALVATYEEMKVAAEEWLGCSVTLSRSRVVDISKDPAP